MPKFAFRTYPVLSDGEIDLTVERETPGEPNKGWLPAYHFGITLHGRKERIGAIDIRIGYTTSLVRYGGHIGYWIAPFHRGNRFAAKACKLLMPIAQDHGMDVLWITCNPDNWPSRRTCEIVGCTLVEIVDLPEEHEMYQRGERQKCRYRWIVY